MGRYRKKPIVIDAVQFGPENRTELFAMLDTHYMACDKNGDPQAVVIRTLEGNMTAHRGDWIIRGVAGELYPCKDEIFQQLYERAYDEEESP